MDVEIELGSIGSELPEPITMRDRSKPPGITWYRTIVTVSILGFGTWKTVASVQNATIISNTLDWILGVALALLYFWLGEFADAPSLYWLFRRSVIIDVQNTGQLGVETVTSIRQVIDDRWQFLVTIVFPHGQPHQAVVPVSEHNPPVFNSHLNSSSGQYNVSDLLWRSVHMHSQTRPFQWDLLTDPIRFAATSDPAVMEYVPVLQPAQLAAPATTPPVAELYVAHPDLPWLIKISASRYYGNTCVTIGDVLRQLYKALRLSVSRTEYEMAQKTVLGAPDAISSAFERRTQLAGPHRALEHRKGVRRIDFLRGRTQFAGFATTLRPHDGILLLHLNVR